MVFEAMKKSSPKVAFIYTRVSTTRQAEEGVSLDNQLAKCRAKAAELGLEVVEAFTDEGISGREGIDARPGLAKLVKAFRSTPNAVVIVYAVERLARRQRLLWHLLDEKEGEGFSLVSVTQPFETMTPMGRAFLGMIALWSSLEADMASVRTKDALAFHKAQGVKIGGAATSVESLPEETVNMIMELNSHNLSGRDIASRLTELGIPSRRGAGKWHHKTVLTVIKAELAKVAAAD